MSTTAKFLGWVQGRAHANTPIEITGIPLPHQVLNDVKVTGYFPALKPPEVGFYFSELSKDDFTIGSQIELTVTEVPKEATVEAPAPLIAQTTQAPLTTATVGASLIGVVTTSSTTTADAPIVDDVA